MFQNWITCHKFCPFPLSHVSIPVTCPFPVPDLRIGRSVLDVPLLFHPKCSEADIRSRHAVNPAGYDVRMAHRSYKHHRPRPRRLRKPLSISLTSRQRLLLVDAPRSFSNKLFELLVRYITPPVLVYLHTIPLGLPGHLAIVAAMLFVLHSHLSLKKHYPLGL